MAQWQREETFLWDEELGNGTVVSDEGSDDTKGATGLRKVGLACEFSRGEDSESSSKECEQGDETDVLPQSADEHQECEHEPRNQVDSKSIVELSGRALSIGVDDTAARDQNGCVAHPEGTIGGECSGAKDVATGEFPHSSEKLDETTGENSHADDDIGSCYSASLNIDEGEDESC